MDLNLSLSLDGLSGKRNLENFSVLRKIDLIFARKPTQCLIKKRRVAYIRSILNGRDSRFPFLFEELVDLAGRFADFGFANPPVRIGRAPCRSAKYANISELDAHCEMRTNSIALNQELGGMRPLNKIPQDLRARAFWQLETGIGEATGHR